MYSHGHHHTVIGEISIRKGAMSESAQNSAASGTECAGSENVSSDMICRPTMSEEDDALLCNEGIE